MYLSVCLSVCLSVTSSGAFYAARTRPLTPLLAPRGPDGVTIMSFLTHPIPLISN